MVEVLFTPSPETEGKRLRMGPSEQGGEKAQRSGVLGWKDRGHVGVKSLYPLDKGIDFIQDLK